MTRRRKSRKKQRKTERLTASGERVRKALQLTFVLKGHIKRANLAYIHVGVELARVRDEKMYADLKHPNMEDYAEKRLGLGRASLYRYLQVHEWVSRYHPEWLDLHTKEHIPDLADVGDLIWIEKELRRKSMGSDRRNALDALREKALNGTLKTGELSKWRKQSRKGGDTYKALVSLLRRARRRVLATKGVPQEVVSHLDTAIDVLSNARPLDVAALHVLDAAQWAQKTA